MRWIGDCPQKIALKQMCAAWGSVAPSVVAKGKKKAAAGCNQCDRGIAGNRRVHFRGNVEC